MAQSLHQSDCPVSKTTLSNSVHTDTALLHLVMAIYHLKWSWPVVFCHSVLSVGLCLLNGYKNMPTIHWCNMLKYKLFIPYNNYN